jgi:hypothetical protein
MYHITATTLYVTRPRTIRPPPRQKSQSRMEHMQRWAGSPTSELRVGRSGGSRADEPIDWTADGSNALSSPLPLMLVSQESPGRLAPLPALSPSRTLIAALHRVGPRALQGMSSLELSCVLEEVDASLRPEDRVRASASANRTLITRRASPAAMAALIMAKLQRAEESDRDALTDAAFRALDAVRFAEAFDRRASHR